jgi:SAM-dependent methyltransferase
MKYPNRTDFDEYASEYDASLNLGISVSGEDKLYFARGRVDWLRRCLEKIGEKPARAFDFGCGLGTSIPFLLDLVGVETVLGIDSSAKSLEIGAKQFNPQNVQMIPLQDYRPAGHLDLGFSSGVFHHIPPAGRPAAMQLIYDSLRPNGVFSLWENNPWNPGARYVMKRIPFDRDAIMVSAREACRLARAAGFEILRVDFLFIFPRSLRWFRGVEPLLSRFPFGAQYQVLCRRPRKDSPRGGHC